MKTARIVVLGVAVTAGLGAAYLVAGSKPPEPVRVAAPPPPPVVAESILVAARDLAFGSIVAIEDMRWQSWPKDQVPQGVIAKTLRPNALDEVKGSIVRSNFLSGEPLRPDRLIKGVGSGFMAAVLPSGSRAVAINIDEIGSLSSETILTNVRVLAIGPNIQEKSGERSVAGSTATLELTPEQSELVILAQRTSQLSLTLRSIADSSKEGTAPTFEQPQSITIVRFGNASQARVR